MDAVSIHEAKTHFSRLVARAEAGEEIVVRRGPTPVAKKDRRLPRRPRRRGCPGRSRAEITIADDFDDTPGRLRRVRRREPAARSDTHAVLWWLTDDAGLSGITSPAISEFRAHAFQAAVSKARELGWIV